jgi:surface adhesion protein
MKLLKFNRIPERATIMKTKHQIIFALLSVTLFLTASAGSAWANVAANSSIINNATLSYNDGTGTRTATASVTVTVALVPSIPTVVPGPPQTTSYNGPSTLLTNSFTVTASANGPDTYNISSAITGQTNNSGNATATPQTSSISLGATVTLSGSTTTAIVVPSDGTSNNSVNGIVAGSTVVIGVDTRTVQSVSDNATGTSVVTLSSALTAAPAAGIVVAEQKTVLVDVTAGNITTSGTNLMVTKNITVTSATNSSITVTSGTVTDTYTSGVATLSKYVRNVTTPASVTGSPSPYVYNSTNYYPTGVNAKPGEVLEYILVASNSGSGAVTSSVITDVLPTAYVTLLANAYGSAREVTYVSDTGAASYYSAASDLDQATYAAGTLTVRVGTGATNSAGGSIPATSFVLALYRVTVN